MEHENTPDLDLMSTFDWTLILAATALGAFVAGSFATIIFIALGV